MLDKIAPLGDLQHDGEKGVISEFTGIFRVASNALYYLEDSLLTGHLTSSSHLWMFFCKLLWELGVAPNLQECVFCERPFATHSAVTFLQAQGGLACSHCHSQNEPTSLGGSAFRHHYQQVASLKYCQYAALPPIESDVLKMAFLYLCYQCQLEERKFKTVKYLLPS